MFYLIGVDGGGTGCRAVVADMAGNILAKADGGAANIATNLDLARKNILDTIGLAFDKAGIAPSEITNSSAVLGLAGSNLGNYANELASDLPFRQSQIVNDSRITLEGAIGANDGCIAAIGTGSVFACRDKTGVRMLGGWGFLLGDDGSGAALGHDLLRLTILAADGVSSHSDLTRQVLSGFENQVGNIVEAAKNFAPKDFAEFAPDIVTASQNGDVNGSRLMQQHSELVRLSIDAAGFDPAKPFCMLGGLGAIYLNLLPEKYRQAAHPPIGNALSGALQMAKQLYTNP
ncbi:MAG: ATPase [Rhodobacteraceae bacterium]|nr:ATPase [Paracoccaceae bacterium]